MVNHLKSELSIVRMDYDHLQKSYEALKRERLLSAKTETNQGINLRSNVSLNLTSHGELKVGDRVTTSFTVLEDGKLEQIEPTGLTEEKQQSVEERWRDDDDEEERQQDDDERQQDDDEDDGSQQHSEERREDDVDAAQSPPSREELKK